MATKPPTLMDWLLIERVVWTARAVTGRLAEMRDVHEAQQDRL